MFHFLLSLARRVWDNNVKVAWKVGDEMEQRLLFIGDSITDAGRETDDLGHGYALLTAAKLAASDPENTWTFVNRGIGGNKLADLKKRWQADCIDLKPDIVSILIGINDTWHNVGEPEAFATKESFTRFEADYRYLLDRLVESGIKKIVLMEPFVLPEPDDRRSWRSDLDPKIHLIRQLAKEYQAVFVPLDGTLNSLGISYGYEKYTGDDGVHPTLLGHETIANIWIETVKKRKEWFE